MKSIHGFHFVKKKFALSCKLLFSNLFLLLCLALLRSKMSPSLFSRHHDVARMMIISGMSSHQQPQESAPSKPPLKLALPAQRPKAGTPVTDQLYYLWVSLGLLSSQGTGFD